MSNLVEFSNVFLAISGLWREFVFYAEFMLWESRVLIISLFELNSLGDGVLVYATDE